MSAHRTPQRAPRHRLATSAVLLALVLGTAFAPTSMAAPAAVGASNVAGRPSDLRSPSPDIEAQFVSRINSFRASKGLSQLPVHSQLLSVARNWTERMVEAGQISHNPNLASEVQGNWTKLGENVGVGPDVDSLMAAFLRSPAHFKNLADPEWNYVAVGVTRAANGQLYTTHNFMVMAGSTPPPAPPAPPPPSTPTTRPSAPPPTTAPPTAPPTAPTTTTTAPAAGHPTEERVTAVLDPLRSLERG
ncbi:MAG: CAP domain-containing protein [Acidimicrobiales bacterium]